MIKPPAAGARARPGPLAATPGQQREPPPEARQVDQPRAGLFTIKLVRNGPRVPARILLTNGLYSASIDGVPCGASDAEPQRADGVLRIWHYGQEIGQAEYDRLLRRVDRPDPLKPVSLGSLPPLF